MPFEIRNQTVKDPPFPPVHGKTQLSTIIYQPSTAKNRLDPEPGRTPAPRLELNRLSRDTQHTRLYVPVKPKIDRVFAKLFLGTVAAATWFRRPRRNPVGSFQPHALTAAPPPVIRVDSWSPELMVSWLKIKLPQVTPASAFCSSDKAIVRTRNPCCSSRARVLGKEAGVWHLCQTLRREPPRL